MSENEIEKSLLERIKEVERMLMALIKALVTKNNP